MKLYSTAEVALELGISVRRVRQLADSRHVGQVVGGALVFTARELDKLRRRGKPQTTSLRAATVGQASAPTTPEQNH
jgi:hypothetical protein